LRSAGSRRARILADALGLGFHHLGSDALGDLGIDPAVAALAEEVAIDPAAGGQRRSSPIRSAIGSLDLRASLAMTRRMESALT
jgi:hypothetical protein